MAKKKKYNNKNTTTKPREFFCKYAHQYVIRGRWNWDCKCMHCFIGGYCADCEIVHKALYIPAAKRYRIKACNRCFLKTKQIRERIAAEQLAQKIK